MFHKGDPVVLTKIGEELLHRGRGAKTGVVAGEPRNPNYISVRRTGNKTAERWAVGFWRKNRTFRGQPANEVKE